MTGSRQASTELYYSVFQKSARRGEYQGAALQLAE
jgi:hypothetical protein